jgi:hypothetical protein
MLRESVPANHESIFHFQRDGDMIFASTSANNNSGKMNTSMSDKVMAEEYFSRDAALVESYIGTSFPGALVGAGASF